MLDILSFGVFGIWLGYLARRLLNRLLGKVARFGISFCVAIVLIIMFVWAGSSGEAAGRWAFFAALGTFVATGMSSEAIAKLRTSWAGVWLLALFVIIEGARTLLLIEYFE